MKSLSWFPVFIIALAASLGALYIDRSYFRDSTISYANIADHQKEILGRFADDSLPAFGANVNFIAAAQRVQDGVVYIRSTLSETPGDLRRMHEDVPGFDEFFQGPGRQNEASGSGVILSDDGFIVTNNHVVEHASSLEVILHNKQSYQARVVGKDPTTDLALLKIDASGLPFLPYGNSDKTTIGEWVLAVGNPFDLTSTVTAGIISGKGRAINILREKSSLAIESFLQTDAAVNPGNSGGALVNLKGELVGINTAIASPTGSYSGYSFAVPVNLVKKVIQDLKEFGTVQRGLLGVSVLDVTAALAKEKGLGKIEGVFIREVSPGSGAEQADLEKGDVVLSVEGMAVNSVSELQELVGRFRPGDKIAIRYRRGTEEKETKIQLRNQEGNTSIRRSTVSSAKKVPELGAEIQPLDPNRLGEYGLRSGLEVSKLEGGPLAEAGVREGSVLLRLDKQDLTSVTRLQEIYKKGKGGLLLELLTPAGEREYVVLVKP
jgi:Do/DeqQ family serine protease